MCVDPEIDVEWARIPHFYYTFYVYQYATAFAAAVTIGQRIFDGDKNALEGYFNFLKGGSSMKPTELLKLCGLEGDANTPVIGIVTRFVDQKGLDLVEAVLPDILADDVRLIVLGTGDYRYEQMFIEAKRRWPDKVSASIMFSGDLANRIYAGADMFLMPSKFEPCGLAQMIALRYGTIPIVRETGGLKDTVHAFVDYAGTGNGFTFASYNAHDMLHVIREACGVFRFNKPAWSKLIMQGMQSDFSWGSSADKYIEVYKTAMGQ